MQLPAVDESRCVGTDDCVRLCPAACLEMAAGVPWLPRPLDCVACGICADVCPTAAISLTSHPAGRSPPPSTSTIPPR